MIVAKIATIKRGVVVVDRLDSMRLFIRIAELGSFSAAARQLNVARSVVTRQLVALEKHLGITLLARSTRQLSLTSAGSAYLEKCREILQLVELAEANAIEDEQSPRGHIRITLPFSFGIHPLMPMFGEFMNVHPEISLELEFSDQRVNLIEGGFDLAIRISDRLNPSDVARKIGKSREVIVAASRYLEKNGRPNHPSELTHYECFGYLLATRSSWAFVVDGVLQWFPIHGRLQATSGDALLTAAISGLGITNAPMFMADQAIRAGKLEILLPEFPTSELGIYAIYPSNRYIPHRVSVLVDYLAQQIKLIESRCVAVATW
ncbi:MAG TPA: LysR family transcriptional regulator [Halothiobacillus sp.]|jgi:DNA-binding transcriptional LysR family regulator|nr:LysR family transcriptional regulator [Halothiobacillus sp.]HUN00133.1 LysR family transcriptional regulator [Halothiobacillus sp.]